MVLDKIIKTYETISGHHLSSAFSFTKRSFGMKMFKVLLQNLKCENTFRTNFSENMVYSLGPYVFYSPKSNFQS